MSSSRYPLSRQKRRQFPKSVRCRMGECYPPLPLPPVHPYVVPWWTTLGASRSPRGLLYPCGLEALSWRRTQQGASSCRPSLAALDRCPEWRVCRLICMLDPQIHAIRRLTMLGWANLVVSGLILYYLLPPLLSTLTIESLKSIAAWPPFALPAPSH